VGPQHPAPSAGSIIIINGQSDINNPASAVVPGNVIPAAEPRIRRIDNIDAVLFIQTYNISKDKMLFKFTVFIVQHVCTRRFFKQGPAQKKCRDVVRNASATMNLLVSILMNRRYYKHLTGMNEISPIIF
jgi:hypothetical protein